MNIRLAALALTVVAAPLSAQEQSSQQGWPSEGWAVLPLEDAPTLDMDPGAMEIVPAPLEGGPVLEMYDTPIPDGIGFDTEPMATPDLVTEVAASGAVLRWLDRVSGETVDLSLSPGQVGRVGRLSVVLGECRYPADNPASDAFAFLTIHEEGQDRPLFSGWMLASSPALNALDHPRYDIWVLRCNKS